MFHKDKDKDKNKNYIKVNFNIRASSVRVVQDGNQLGVMPIDKARKLAMDAGLDLVELVPNANPPVCSILDFDKYRYEKRRKEKDQKKNQKIVEIKELRFSPSTQDHDIETKVNAAKRFIAEGKKVVFNVQFSRRELMHKDEGFKIIKKVIDFLGESVSVESPPKMEGTRLICRVGPKND
jgi:translation initiation factor IF-3